jgi:hypothetical protein
MTIFVEDVRAFRGFEVEFERSGARIRGHAHESGGGIYRAAGAD